MYCARRFCESPPSNAKQLRNARKGLETKIKRAIGCAQISDCHLEEFKQLISGANVQSDYEYSDFFLLTSHGGLLKYINQ